MVGTDFGEDAPAALAFCAGGDGGGVMQTKNRSRCDADVRPDLCVIEQVVRFR